MMKKMLMGVAVMAALAGCSGCSTTALTDTQITVYGLQKTYIVAQTLARGYAHLPYCPQNAPVCSTPAAVIKMDALDGAAVKALNDAQAVVTGVDAGANTATALATAAAAVSAFDNFVTANKVPQ